jgi:hypothetical protein
MLISSLSAWDGLDEAVEYDTADEGQRDLDGEEGSDDEADDAPGCLTVRR